MATISGASHLMHEDNPEEANRVMLEFLGAPVREPLRAAS
jgi:hypothetical protein